MPRRVLQISLYYMTRRKESKKIKRSLIFHSVSKSPLQNMRAQTGVRKSGKLTYRFTNEETDGKGNIISFITDLILPNFMVEEAISFPLTCLAFKQNKKYHCSLLLPGWNYSSCVYRKRSRIAMSMNFRVRWISLHTWICYVLHGKVA